MTKITFEQKRNTLPPHQKHCLTGGALQADVGEITQHYSNFVCKNCMFNLNLGRINVMKLETREIKGHKLERA
jgi:hypothetical protein